MAITMYDGNARQMNQRNAMQEAARLLHEVRPEDIVSMDTVMSPHTFEREVRIIFRVPNERAEMERQLRQSQLERLINTPVQGIRINSPFDVRPVDEPDDDDEDDERLRRLGIR